jgi:hypothetical protein
MALTLCQKWLNGWLDALTTSTIIICSHTYLLRTYIPAYTIKFTYIYIHTYIHMYVPAKQHHPQQKHRMRTRRMMQKTRSPTTIPAISPPLRTFGSWPDSTTCGIGW